MKIVVCGLSISSAWGNGHATLLRGLFRALHSNGHETHFFERDTPYYAQHRDAETFPYVHLQLYSEWLEAAASIRAELVDADVAMVTSYCADGKSACKLALESSACQKVFYDMDTPVTLSRVRRGESVEYLPSNGLGDFDLVLSYTGGTAINALKDLLGARAVKPLYGWVDPQVHHPADRMNSHRADLSYLGTYAADRQGALEEFLIAPARRLPERRFLVGGPLYPDCSEWPPNIAYQSHVPPSSHPAFYCSSRLTLNITRGAMATTGYCPSGRLFEAAACGTPVLSDWWAGLDEFFEPEREILIATSSEDTVAALRMDAGELRGIGRRARERALDCHTAEIRAQQFIDLIETRTDNEQFESTAYACKRE